MGRGVLARDPPWVAMLNHRTRSGPATHLGHDVEPLSSLGRALRAPGEDTETTGAADDIMTTTQLTPAHLGASSTAPALLQIPPLTPNAGGVPKKFEEHVDLAISRSSLFQSE